MTITKSFRAKLVLLALAPLAATLLVTLTGLSSALRQDVSDRSSSTLTTATEVAGEYLSGRNDYLRARASELALDPGLGNSESTASALAAGMTATGADIAMLYDGSGAPSVVAGLAAEFAAPVLPAIAGADGEQAFAHAIVELRGEHYEIHAARRPATESESWLAIGHRLDQDLVKQLERLTGVDVALVAIHDETVRLVEASRVLRRPGLDLSGIAGDDSQAPVQVGDDSVGFLGGRLPLADGAGALGAEVLLLLPLDNALASFATAARSVLIVVSLLAAIALVCALRLTTSITTPLRRLASASRSVTAGSYDGNARGEQAEEFDDLSRSFDAMQKAVAERERRLSWQALHDPLTNLPNHRHIVAKLSQCIDQASGREEPVSVLSIRLARIRKLRRTLGYAAGDELILLAACQLQANLDAGAVLGQAGSAEFVMLLPGKDADGASASVERLRGILAAGVGLDRVTISLQAEFGIATFPDHGSRAADLVRRAAIARSEANADDLPVAVFDADCEVRHARELCIVNDLRAAIDSGEVEPWYQPRIDLAHGRVVGVEALARWNHPEFGLLSPDEFIDAAEQSGSITQLTRHVLATAVGECAGWRDRGLKLNVSVNLGRRDLADDTLPQFVLKLLRDHDVEPQQLTLEVTEQAVLCRPAAAQSLLESLRDLGVRLSMDNFGTGPSSLGQLRQLPFHQIKIDRKFVAPLPGSGRDELIVRTITDLAHGLDIEVVAEGVESEEAARLLADAGCEKAQGYFFCKPLPAADCLEWLEAFEPLHLNERRRGNRPFSRRPDDEGEPLARAITSA